MSISTIGLDGAGFTEIVGLVPPAEQAFADWRPVPR